MLNFQDFLLFTLCFFHFERQNNLKYPEKKKLNLQNQKQNTVFSTILYRNKNNGFQLTRNVFIPEATSGIEGEFLAWRRGPESLPPGPGPRGARLKGGRRLKVEALMEGLASEIRS